MKTINEIQDGLKKKFFTPVQLVDSYLERINKHNKDLNCLLTVSDDLAYEQAKALETSDMSQPLAGIVFALKDIFITRNLRTTAASDVLKDYIPEYSGTVVKKLEDAGAIIIGKASCDAWAHGASGENSDFGPTKNPWDMARVPGGSSSGSAVSVAAGFSLAALGTDTGGSIRNPANFCGVVGLKPTYGAVSRYGVIAMASSLDCVGPMAHTVEDVKKIFNVIKGEDGFDSTVKDHPTPPRLRGTSKFRIGIPREYFIKGIDSEVEKAVMDAVAVFKKKGVEIVEISLPHTKYGVSVYYIIQPAEVSSNLGRFDGVRFGHDRSHFGDEAKRRIMLGAYVLSSGYYDAYYLKASKVRTKIIEDFDKAFDPSADGVDAIIAPVSPHPAFKIGEKASDPLQMYLEDIFTVSANLAGIPAISIPGGFSKSGLPIGFQLMGARFNEDVLFKLGEMYQQETDWHIKEPSL